MNQIQAVAAQSCLSVYALYKFIHISEIRSYKILGLTGNVCTNNQLDQILDDSYVEWRC